MEDQTLEEQLDLSLKGSLGNLYVATHQKSQKKTKKKSKSPEQKVMNPVLPLKKTTNYIIQKLFQNPKDIIANFLK